MTRDGGGEWMAEIQNNRDLYLELGEIKGKQEMIIKKLTTIEEKLDKKADEIAEVKGSARVIGGVTSLIVTVITNIVIALGLRKI